MSRPFPDPPATVPQALERAAAHFADRGIAIFDGRGRAYERRTYPEVLAATRRAAGRWAARGLEPGDRVLVCLPTSWAWFDAWFGVVLCGALPVAVAPVAAMGATEAQVSKVEALIERLGARWAVTSAGFRHDAERFAAHRTVAAAITGEELEAVTPAAAPAPSPAAEEIAFLQLTSGSSGLPRAVRIPHRAAIHNPLANDEAIGGPHGAPTHVWAEAMVSWLPLHHDMGLVGCLLMSIIAGLDLWLFQPSTFLARPRRWLEELGRHGVAFAPAPNFGYQLCVERLSGEALAGIDLSPWRAAMTGAEMIRPDTVAAFCEAFAPCGFRPEVFRPCYGLAEGTLAVTFDLQGAGVRTRPLPEGALGVGPGTDLGDVVCVGEPVRDTEVRITGPGDQPLPDGEIGEVRLHGPGVFAGYYNDPEATAEGLRDGWLATGDLGFLHAGELYITGRTKDLLIIRGHNFMPHEFEWLAESVTGGGGTLRSGAFSVTRGAQGEQAVMVVEIAERDPDKLAEMGRAIRSRIGRTLSLPIADLAFVRRGKIPKTTSGKVQRQKLRALYLEGKLERIAAS